MGKKNTKEKEQFAFSARPVKPKKKSAPAEMFGVDDLTDHTNNPGAYHLRMISYRATLTNLTGLGPKEGEVSAVHLHRDPVFLTGKFDPILHRTDYPVSDLWMNLPVVNSWTSLPVKYVRPDQADRNSSLRTG